MRKFVLMAVICVAAVSLISCDIMSPDGGPGSYTPGGRGYFYMLERSSVSLIMLDAQMHELDRWSLYPFTGDSSLQGVTFDGRYIWVSSAGGSDKLYQLEATPDTMTLLKSFDAPPMRRGTVRDIAWDGVSLWAINSGSSTYATPPMIYKLDAATGGTRDSFLLPTLEPRGLTFVLPSSDVYGRGPALGLYYTDITANRAYVFHTDRPLFDTAFSTPVPPRGTSYNYPAGITYDGVNFWVVNSSGVADHLFRLDYTGKLIERIDLPYSNPGPIVWTMTDIRVPVPLTVLGCIPSMVLKGVTTNVQVIGTGFRQGTGLAVSFGDSIATQSVTFNSPTMLTATIVVAPGAPNGKRLVRVTLPDGRAAADSLLEVSGATPYLYMADQRTGAYTMNKVRVNDSTLVQSWATTSVSAGSPQGVAFDGTSLWVCASGTDKKIYKVDTTGGSLAAVSVISAPPTTGTLRGIAYYGGAVWLSISTTARIYKLDPLTGAILDSLSTPGTEPRGITFANGQLYCNDTNLDSVYVWNSGSKTWSSVFQTPIPPGSSVSRFATGLAFDGTAFWIANSTTASDYIFKVSATGVILQYFKAPLPLDPQITGMVYISN